MQNHPLEASHYDDSLFFLMESLTQLDDGTNLRVTDQRYQIAFAKARSSCLASGLDKVHKKAWHVGEAHRSSFHLRSARVEYDKAEWEMATAGPFVFQRQEPFP